MRMESTARSVGVGVAVSLCAAMIAGPAAPAAGQRRTEEELSWSVQKLPGCEDLPQRMAKHYKPAPLDYKPAAKPYPLPLDLTKLTNKDFAGKISDLRDATFAEQAKAALARNGFVVLGKGYNDDVVKFYQAIQARELPVFITSDSLLHLYHIQFGQTLREIEERQFYTDAITLSKAIQTEALKLHAVVEDDLKEPVRLLVGYATVPLALLGQTDLAAEARAALAEVQTWTDRPNWRQMEEFSRKYDELLTVMAREHGTRKEQFIYLRKPLLASLARYIKEHPIQREPPGIPAICRKQVLAELDLIAAHRDARQSPLFVYKEDYSQYVPRGHYTRSKRLRQYFKALTWYGRMTFLLRGGDGRKIKALVSVEEARKQTLAACILASLMAKRADRRSTIARLWDRLYTVTSYYVGLADDLTPYEYRGVLRDAFGDTFTHSRLMNEANFFEVRRRLAKIRKPEIYSGLGNAEGPAPLIVDEESLARALGMTQGLRLMGRPYVPDSFIMDRLVYPAVGKFNGKGIPFTFVVGGAGGVRGFPRGLDVMAVLGSGRAEQWLTKLGDNAYQEYDETLADLMARFEKVDQAGWNRNLYWSWLHVLQTLLKEYPAGYPTFMQTQGWQDKQLSAALASWSQLRHDTVLYATQPRTPRRRPPPRSSKMVQGYVEPVPEFYARLLALTRMTYAGLYGLRVLDSRARRRLQRLQETLARLLSISKHELNNQKLSSNDYRFIRDFAGYLKYAVAGVQDEGLQTTTIAAVHTDANTRRVLQEATGRLHSMIVVYPMPDGGLVAGVGPVLTHYEFKHPMSDRLTDEAWKKLLRSVRRPKLPPWTETFTVLPPARRFRTKSAPKFPVSRRRALPAP